MGNELRLSKNGPQRVLKAEENVAEKEAGQKELNEKRVKSGY